MSVRPTSRNSILAMPAGGERISTRVRHHSVLTDQPQRAGGDDTAPTPLELLGASLAGCIALYLGRYCAGHDLDAADLAVEVKPFWRDDPGRIARFDVVVHVPEGLPTEHRAALEAVARSCPVHNTLAHAPELTLQVQEASLAGAT